MTRTIPIDTRIQDCQLRRQKASRAGVGRRRQHQTIVDNRTLAMTGREVVDPLRDLREPQR
jgi:hypothetical protein